MADLVRLLHADEPPPEADATPSNQKPLSPE